MSHLVLDGDEEETRRAWSADLRRVGGLAVVFLVVAASTASMLDRSNTVLLPEPRALVGCIPQGVSSPTGAMNSARSGHTATLLRSGKVLVAGGWDDFMQSTTSSAELYDPTTGTWSLTGSMKLARAFHAAALLPSGKVLVAGGRTVVGLRPPTYESITSAELYDPDTGNWTGTGGMRVGRDSFAAMVLRSGKVFATPGSSFIGDPTSAFELYDPTSGSWAAIGGLVVPLGSATLLASGKVLVIAGGVAGAQLYDPPTNAWRPTGNMITPRDAYSATLLPSGKVLTAGGHDFQAGYRAGSWAETYDPARGTWTQTTSMTAQRAGADAALLPSGEVLVAGGGTAPQSAAVDSVDVYDPATATWTAPGAMTSARAYFTATLLRSGALLFAGGESAHDGPYSSAEIYTLTCAPR